MNTFDCINARHSYRGQYKDEPVPREDLIKIMEAGLAAPSGCNKQTTSIIAVDDREILDKLKSKLDPAFGLTAPAFICVITKRRFAYRDKCFAIQDYSAAIQNMLLEIVELGYQSCWYEGYITDDDRICDKLEEVLGVPEEYDMVCVLPVGIATEEAILPRKKPFEMRAWFNGFEKMSH